MLQLKVIVNKLNKRQAPVLDFADKSNIVGIALKGFTFTGEEESNILGKWYRDQNGHYYWGGGLTVEAGEISIPEPSPTVSDQLPPSPINYASFFTEAGSDGKGIRIAVLDSGFFQHAAFNNEVKTIKDFTGSGGDANDLVGHGTHVAGIIGARLRHSSFPMVGVAPECEIIVGKVIPENGGTNDVDFIVKGIEWAIEQNVKVINLSLGIKDKDIPLLAPTIQKAAARNIILVAAAGDVKGLDNNRVQYPAAEFDHCISVADVSKTYLSSNPIINPRVNFLSGYSHYMSTSIPLHDFYEPLRGSSMATAFVSGIIVRILSRLSQSGTDITAIKKDTVVTELNKITVPKTNLNFNDFSKFKIATI
jgi:subtilisin family serine protease